MLQSLLVPGSPLRPVMGSLRPRVPGEYEPPEFAVDNRTAQFGADTRAGAGSISFGASAGEIGSIGTPGGSNVADWDIQFAGGTVTVAPAGNGLSNGPYSLTVPCYSGAGQSGTLVNMTLTIETPANTYHIRESGGSVTQFNAARSAGLAGKTVILRTGSEAGDIALNGVTISGAVTLRGEMPFNRPAIRSLLTQNIGASGEVFARDIKLFDDTDANTELAYYSGAGKTIDFEDCDFEGGFDTDRPYTDYYWFVTFSGASGSLSPGDAVTGGTSGGQSNVIAISGNTVWLDGGTRGGNPLTPDDLISGETLSKDGGGWSATLTSNADYVDIGGRINGISTNSTATLFENVRVKNCTFKNMGRPAHIVARGGDAVFDDNVMTDTFGDLIQINPCGTTGYQDNPPSYTSISGNISAGHPTNPRMVGNPHPDGIQMMGFYLSTQNWENIKVNDNRFVVASVAGDNISGFFISNFPGGITISGEWCNNFFPLCSLSHGIDLGGIAVNSKICNNTVVNDDYSNAILQAAIVASGSGNIVRNNVCNILTAAGVAENDNNVVLGSFGGTVAYATAFAGPTFGRITDLADGLAKFTPKSGGPLLDGATYVLGDVGCIDSNGEHVAWDPASIGEGAGAPEYTGTVSNLNYTEGVAITPVDFSAKFSGGTPTSYAISATPPAGLSFNTSTGVLSGTPTDADDDVTGIYVTATNSEGSDNTGTFNITIEEASGYTETMVAYDGDPFLHRAAALAGVSNSGSGTIYMHVALGDDPYVDILDIHYDGLETHWLTLWMHENGKIVLDMTDASGTVISSSNSTASSYFNTEIFMALTFDTAGYRVNINGTNVISGAQANKTFPWDFDVWNLFLLTCEVGRFAFWPDVAMDFTDTDVSDLFYVSGVAQDPALSWGEYGEPAVDLYGANQAAQAVDNTSNENDFTLA